MIHTSQGINAFTDKKPMAIGLKAMRRASQGAANMATQFMTSSEKPDEGDLDHLTRKTDEGLGQRDKTEDLMIGAHGV